MPGLKKRNISQSFESILIMQRIKVATVAFTQKLYLEWIELLLSLLVAGLTGKLQSWVWHILESTLLMVGSHNLVLLCKCVY